jgi:hypothetical protein
MNATLIQALVWLTAGVILMMLLLRRRKRKSSM